MPALGAGSACDYCAARGLCRRDFWNDVEATEPEAVDG
jgi:ATP-dependent helicase/nuclease subunit B